MSIHGRAVVCLWLAVGCSGPSDNSGPASTNRIEPSPQAVPARPTLLPATPPVSLEIDYRMRTEEGDDIVLKLTDQGARYGLAHGKVRVALRFGIDPTALASIYDTLRMESFDGIQTVQRPQPSPRGTSLRLTAGPARYSASDMGRNEPAPEWTAAYAHAVEAVETLRPTATGPVVVRIRWDESMAGQAVAVDLQVGDDLLGVHRQPGPLPNVDIHLARARTVDALVRFGSPATSTRHHIEAGRDLGVRIAHDPTTTAVTVTPLPAEPR
ncbi:MAG: hypothetical protein K0V04_38890 [Deltaproteobacteria bacterium]|nr:hypothetical protein [Deltaproteobacteria bacterium]